MNPGSARHKSCSFSTGARFENSVMINIATDIVWHCSVRAQKLFNLIQWVMDNKILTYPFLNDYKIMFNTISVLFKVYNN